jgi:hypothetical protein
VGGKGVDKKHRGVKMHLLGNTVKVVVLINVSYFQSKRYTIIWSSILTFVNLLAYILHFNIIYLDV